MTHSGFEEKVNVIEHKLDSVVDTGSDDELFYASYLQGHFSVVASLLLQTNEPSMLDLNAKMQTSLNNAFENNELEKPDQHHVLNLWENMFTLVE